jgi:hypothetical protein
MRVVLVALVLGAALLGGSAAAQHRHVQVWPHVGFGYYGDPFGYYGPYYSPWYGPRFGVGIHIGDRYPVRRVRTQRAERGEQRALTLYVYPSAGQSEQQTADDRYECHVWAADRSGHDPTLGAGTRADADGYTRAFSACMEGRNYVVK